MQNIVMLSDIVLSVVAPHLVAFLKSDIIFEQVLLFAAILIPEKGQKIIKLERLILATICCVIKTRLDYCKNRAKLVCFKQQKKIFFNFKTC
jgi:hypothetical protein